MTEKEFLFQYYKACHENNYFSDKKILDENYLNNFLSEKELTTKEFWIYYDPVYWFNHNILIILKLEKFIIDFKNKTTINTIYVNCTCDEPDCGFKKEKNDITKTNLNWQNFPFFKPHFVLLPNTI